MTDSERQEIVDNEHLKVLSIVYYVSAGMSAFFGLFGLVYVAMGIFVAIASSSVPSESDEAAIGILGLFFVLFGLVFFLVPMTLAVLKFLAARMISQRRSRGFCFAIAAVTSLGIPIGTAIGVFTFVVLSRDSVVRSFESARQQLPADPM
jgi:hypothetical protein